ncbi:MAG: hypothetical protein JSV56_08280 [Methanomassiliicoccales archaeon]|nr:MAG: hypothetical protein JSV56_08280 [Methanomassiliicoccales archaeon]
MVKLSPRRNYRFFSLIAIGWIYFVLLSAFISSAEVTYELDYQDPAGDVLDFNETWHQLGTVDSHPEIDIKWLRSYNDTQGNVVLRLEVRKNQFLDISNKTKYVFRIFTAADNLTGYNVTFQNGTTAITNFNGTIEDDLTSETSIIDDNGEVLLVNISKNNYLSNIPNLNIDAFTWKEHEGHTYIDYISEVPGHPGEVSPELVDDSTNDGDDDSQGLFGMLCTFPFILIWIILVVIILIIIVVLLKW